MHSRSVGVSVTGASVTGGSIVTGGSFVAGASVSTVVASVDTSGGGEGGA